MPYCLHCGKEVSPSARFCEACGAELKKDPQTFDSAPAQHGYTPAPQSPDADSVSPEPLAKASGDGEHVQGVIFLRKPKSLGRYDSFNAVITDRRLVIAQMTGEMVKRATQEARDRAKAEGKGFFGQWADQLRSSLSFGQRYLAMDPAAILAETPGNFAIDDSGISELKLGLKHIRQGNTETHELELEIRSSTGRYEYRMDDNADNVKALKERFGERVRTPVGYFSGIR
jgi:hypothetical protein